MTGSSTLPEPRSPAHIRRARNWRRVGLTLLVAFVLLGATGSFGPRTGTTSATGGGYDVQVTYPVASRPGHASAYQVQVTRHGGFDGPVHMRFSTDYFNLFDQSSFDPSPDSVTSTGAYEICEFSPPPGDTFTVSANSRIKAARQRGEKGEVSVLDDNGRPVATVRYRTRIFP